MCLQINDIREDARVAEKPITVYKILRRDENTFFTPYTYFACVIGDTLSASTKEHDLSYGADHGIISSEGVHAYRTLLGARCSTLPYCEFTASSKFYITEWEIPKGTTYWLGVERSILCIAATEMKFVGVVEKRDVAGSPIDEENYLLSPFHLDNKKIKKLATHYFTDAGEIKPIEEGQRVDDWHVCWAREELRKYIPDTITYQGNEYNFFEVKRGATVTVGYKPVTVGYKPKNHSDYDYDYVIPNNIFEISRSYTQVYAYACLISDLINCNIISIDNLKF